MRFVNGCSFLLMTSSLVVAGLLAGCGGGGSTPTPPVKTTPAITWAAPAAVPVGSTLGATQLDASASVAGTFVYTPAAGSVLSTVGSTTLSAAFTPNDTTDYNSASSSVTIIVNSATPTITWATPAAVTVGTALSSTQLNATANVAGTFAYTPAAGTVLNTVGTTTLSATFTPTNPLYNTATDSVSLAVNKATPVITWTTPAAVNTGTTLSSTQLDATANVAGTFVYTPAAGTVLNTAGTTTLSTVFTPTDSADYTTATDSVMLSVAAPAGTATIDFGTTEQTIRGFGGSTAFMPQISSGQASALYGNGTGQLGLSILRVRIDPSSTTGGASNWGTELANAQAALAVNPNAIVFATPWTPPAAWKATSTSQPYNTGCTSTPTSLCGGYLNPANYDDYASYLESFVTFMANGGVNLYGISMQNEPDENVTYESCVWTPAQMDTWVAQSASVLTTKLIMPESSVFNTAYSDPSLNDPNAVGNIGIVGMHLYMNGTSQGSPFLYTNAVNNNKDVWMTEHYLTPPGAQPGMADAIQAAEEVHNSLTVGNYNAYVWWWFIDWNPGTPTNYGLIDTNSNPNYYGYAVGQFSRFVKPGYVRVNATATPAAGIYVSAYSGSGHSVIVAINSTSAAASLQFVIQNQTMTSVTPYQTTSAGGLTPLTAIPVAGGEFTGALPAQSITTFAQ
jgi:O-glycosyl hydrolase